MQHEERLREDEEEEEELVEDGQDSPGKLDEFLSNLFSIGPLKFANEWLNRKDEAALNICP